jgi:myo-inositol-1(or 4)-monophosphatase
VDRVAEEAMFVALRAMVAEDGTGMTVISEEAGVVEIGAAAGGPVVVVDPVDGSQNAKRGAPLFSTSVAVADSHLMGAVRLAYVRDHSTGEEFTAERGVGAWLDGRRIGPPTGPSRIRLLAVEGASALHSLHAASESLVGQVGGLRSLGSVALSMCWVAAGRMDGFIGLKPMRAMDVAATQLILREAGCQVGFPGIDDLDGCPLALGSRRWVMATSEEGQLERLRVTLDAAVAAG